MKHEICSACETVQHCSKNGCISVTVEGPTQTSGRADSTDAAAQARNETIREAMAAIAHTESRAQALEILGGLLKP
ncbi:hypothetical protein ABL840_04880 [Variovorax sp. NFACC27]|uniref:hypothetical protein n=1 Tax=unclassified Variovorax TaxID=663243 RepID=UPI00089737AF|nr:hypothetical protein SAMN03159371_00111 [Variovorax sp. NFACC28]SEF72766.1 hypothetical protein SAMN03159365_00706 [Variovorax sp. NFACC29]SFB77400.1 hypothetical protein SAMN03159379_00705 [Variovorax sp. NFACC26]SFG76990.1 hypothetical protein SAMN03159447_04828 [Variovorax sp. NFACC27]